jgi:hypothetical protein
VLSRVRARAAALLGLELNTFAPHAEDLQVQKGRLRPLAEVRPPRFQSAKAA